MIDFHVGKKIKISNARLREFLDFEHRVFNKMKPLPDEEESGMTGSMAAGTRGSAAARSCCTLYGDMLS